MESRVGSPELREASISADGLLYEVLRMLYHHGVALNT